MAALLGWSLIVVDAAETFDRRYVVVTPDWPEECGEKHEILHIRRDLEPLTEEHPDFASHQPTPPLEETVTKATAFGTQRDPNDFFDDGPLTPCAIEDQGEPDFYV